MHIHINIKKHDSPALTLQQLFRPNVFFYICCHNNSLGWMCFEDFFYILEQIQIGGIQT